MLLNKIAFGPKFLAIKLVGSALREHQGKHVKNWIVAVTLCVFALVQYAATAHDENDHVHDHEIHVCGLCNLAVFGDKALSPSGVHRTTPFPTYIDSPEQIGPPLNVDQFDFYTSRAPPFFV